MVIVTVFKERSFYSSQVKSALQYYYYYTDGRTAVGRCCCYKCASCASTLLASLTSVYVSHHLLRRSRGVYVMIESQRIMCGSRIF